MVAAPMNEAEVETTADAAFYVANEVVDEYHAIPCVQRADFGINALFLNLNGKWFRFEVSEVVSPTEIDDLERLVR